MKQQSGEVDFFTLMIILILAVWAVIYIGNAIEAPVELEQKKLLFEHKKELVKEATQILVDLESLNHPVVSQFVNDWRLYYSDNSEISSAVLAELKIIQQRIKANPESASEMTWEYHRQKHAKLSSAIESPFGFDLEPDTKPGL